MNLLDDGVEEVAARVHRRILDRQGTWTIFVRGDGKVAMDQVGGPERKKIFGASTMVGVYTRQAHRSDIAADLAVRLEEIDMGRLAA